MTENIIATGPQGQQAHQWVKPKELVTACPFCSAEITTPAQDEPKQPGLYLVADGAGNVTAARLLDNWELIVLGRDRFQPIENYVRWWKIPMPEPRT